MNRSIINIQTRLPNKIVTQETEHRNGLVFMRIRQRKPKGLTKPIAT